MYKKYQKIIFLLILTLTLGACGTDFCVSLTNGYAIGNIKTIAANLIGDTETFALDDGTNTPLVFEFDRAGDGVNAANVSVAISALTTDTEVRDAIITAINIQLASGTTNIGATFTNANTVNLANTTTGKSGNKNITETVGDTGFTTSGMSGGCG